VTKDVLEYYQKEIAADKHQKEYSNSCHDFQLHDTPSFSDILPDG
jgi:hypothetical protein